MKLLNLNNDCIYAIFDQTNLQDLFQIQSVCTRFNGLALCATRSRQSLTILAGKNPQNLLDKSKFLIPNSDDLLKPNGSPMYPRQNANFSIYKFTGIDFIPNFSFISLKMPNITSLTIIIDSDSVVLNNLLKASFPNMSPNLVVLKLNISIIKDLNNQNYEMFDSISKCFPSLKQLHLDFQHGLDKKQTESVLSRLPPLELLYIYLNTLEPNTTSGLIIQVINQFDNKNNSTLSQIGLAHMMIMDNLHIPIFINMKPAFCKKFTLLYISIPQMDNDFEKITQKILSKFINLTTLRLVLRSKSILLLVNCLAMLKQLVNLELHFSTKPQSLNWNIENDDDMDNIAQLTSIKSLNIIIYENIDSHHKLHYPHFGWIFPQLQIVQIRLPNINCLDCCFQNKSYLNQTKLKKIRFECCRLMMEPWKQCPELRFVYVFKSEMYKWSVDML